jgi:hypothetical protein
VAAANRLFRHFQVWPGRRRELVTALKQADRMAVSLRIYWNRGVQEVRGTLDRSEVNSGMVRIRTADVTIRGDPSYAAEDLSVRVKDIRWVMATVSSGDRSDPERSADPNLVVPIPGRSAPRRQPVDGSHRPVRLPAFPA